MRCRLQSWQVYCRLCETLGGYHSKRLQTVGSGTVRIQFFQSGLIPAESDAVSPCNWKRSRNHFGICCGHTDSIPIREDISTVASNQFNALPRTELILRTNANPVGP